MKRICAVLLCLLLLCPVYAGAQTGTVALTFDDGPSGRFTRTLLDGLSERQVKATFLLCGYRLKEYPAEGRRILEEGHEIGLHGFSHRPMNRMGAAELEKELRDTMAVLPSGCRPAFLRPPGGCCSAKVSDAARAFDLGIVNWSVDPKDWATRDVEAITTMVLDNVRDGDIILLHDMSDSSVEAALSIIDRLREQGFCFVTVSELAKQKNIPIEPGKIYNRF